MALPGGRGSRTGPDATVDQEESYDVRKRLSPDANAWVISNDDSYADTDTNVALLTAQQLHMTWVRQPAFVQLGKNATLKAARVVVTTAMAGALLRSALYIYTSETRSISLIPGSQAVFNCSTIGLKTVVLSPTATLYAAGRYLLAVATNNIAAEFRGVLPTAASRLVPGYNVTVPTAKFDSPLQVTRLTKNYTMRTVSVAYLSEEAYQVL